MSEEIVQEAVETESNDSQLVPNSLLAHIEVVCEAVLGNGSISIGELNAMCKGDVLTLDRSPADPIDVKINGKTIARGEIVTVDDRFAILLSEVG